MRSELLVHRYVTFPKIQIADEKVSGVIDTFEDITTEGMSAVRKKVEQRAIDKAVAAGADPKTTTVVESEAIPIACTFFPHH